MKRLSVLYHLARADFLERVRCYSFLIVLGVTILVGYAMVPSHEARYATGFSFCLMPPAERGCLAYARGVHNSAWVGTVMAFMVVNFLSLFGFYLVKNAVERDWQTGVGQIVAATPLSKLQYTLGKWLSNFVLLALMIAVLASSALVMQMVRAEELQIDLWALGAPFLLVALPVMAVIAAWAILFETVIWLRGGWGNAAYFFLWMGFLVAEIEIGWGMLGYNFLMDLMTADFEAAFPGYRISTSAGVNPVKGKLLLFPWEGVTWTSEIVLSRLIWLGVALGIALLAAVFFERFDSAREGSVRLRTPTRRPRRGFLSRMGRRLIPSSADPQAARARVPIPGSQLTPLRVPSPGFSFGRLLGAELYLALKSQRWWWYLIALGMVAASLLAPMGETPFSILVLAWIWPLLIWSAMGGREARYRTDQIVFSAAHPLRRQLPATWLTGVIVAVVTGSGVPLRHAFIGDGPSLFAWGVGALFIPSLAMACGTWSGGSKLFEVLYTILWYLGPIEGLTALDFMGAHSETVEAGVYWHYLAASALLLVLAVIGRKRQIRSV
jgi:hypothetical protein